MLNSGILGLVDAPEHGLRRYGLLVHLELGHYLFYEGELVVVAAVIALGVLAPGRNDATAEGARRRCSPINSGLAMRPPS